MPITQDDKGKWHWGSGHGSFNTKEEAQEQEAAAYASGWKGESKMEKELTENEIAELLVLKSEEAILIKAVIAKVGPGKPGPAPGTKKGSFSTRTAVFHPEQLTPGQRTKLDALHAVMYPKKQEPEEGVGVPVDPDTSQQGQPKKKIEPSSVEGIPIGPSRFNPSEQPPASKFGIIDPGMKMKKKDFSVDEARKIGDELKVNWKNINLEEFRMGLGVELEHKDVIDGDQNALGKIALVHLKELPDYYTRLKAMEMKKEDAITEKVNAFFEKYPSPNDDQVHALAVSLGMTPDKLEEVIYRIAGKQVNKSEDGNPANVITQVDVTNMKPKEGYRSSKPKEFVTTGEETPKALGEPVEISKQVNEIVDNLWDGLMKQDNIYKRVFKEHLFLVKESKGSCSEEDYAEARRKAHLASFMKQELYSDEQQNVIRKLGEDVKVIDVTKDGDLTLQHDGKKYILRTNGEIFAEDDMIRERVIKAQGREGLVPKKVQITRGGKTFEQTIFVRPTGETPSAGGMSVNDKLNDLASEAWRRMNPNERVQALSGVNEKDTLAVGDWQNIPPQVQFQVIHHLQTRYPEVMDYTYPEASPLTSRQQRNPKHFNYSVSKKGEQALRGEAPDVNNIERRVLAEVLRVKRTSPHDMSWRPSPSHLAQEYGVGVFQEAMENLQKKGYLERA